MLEVTPIAVGQPSRQGELCSLSKGRGLVVFTQADGNHQDNRRSRELARRLQQARLSTLLVDLLTPQEAADSVLALDIELLTQRVLQTLDALPPPLRTQPLGLFGSGAGAAAALLAQTRRPQAVAAVVSRSGRPELAGAALAEVSAPTLLIVGAADAEVVELNRRAFAQLRCEKRIELVPRATHLFQEAGALDALARSAVEWFGTHLARHG